MINKLSYSLEGSGEKTIVMLHGWGLDKSAFMLLNNYFNTKAKCLIVDFYGFGDSGMPEYYYDTYEYAYQIFLLLNKLKINNIILVGHSFGGRVAIILSSIFGIDIEGLVLTASAGLNKPSIIKTIRIGVYKFKKCLSRFGLYNRSKLTKAGSDDYKKLNPLMKGVFIKVVNQDLSNLLCKIKTKVKLFWARDDRATPLWICRKLKREIKLSEVVVYNQGGHFVYLKKINSFIKCIEEFI